VTTWMKLNIEALEPKYDAVWWSYLDSMEDETEARIEYEANKASQELKSRL
jgi:hypothetical protein